MDSGDGDIVTRSEGVRAGFRETEVYLNGGICVYKLARSGSYMTCALLCLEQTLHWEVEPMGKKERCTE